jgi:predicted molibdopterin-dependent oxidoreductase YjgC
VHPRIEPGYKPAATEGRDTRAILEAAAGGELDALLVFGADLIADFPDAELVRRALASDTFVVVVELFPTETVSHADVVLPSVAYAEREGTFTNLERRLQKLEPLLSAPGAAREPWDICAGVAKAMGQDWGWSSFDDVWTDIRKNVATHADIDPADLSGEVLTTPAPHYETPFSEDVSAGNSMVAGPGGRYPKGYRSGAPFQTGQNWPLSWELRAFEARERPGLIPKTSDDAESGGEPKGAVSVKDDDARARSSAASGAGSVSAPVVPAAGAASGRAGDLVLYSGRFIYDGGAMVGKSAALRNLAKKPFVELNPDDAQRLGIADGDDVIVAGAGAEVTVAAVVADIAAGAAFVPYDQPGFRANVLMSSTAPTVQVRPA